MKTFNVDKSKKFLIIAAEASSSLYAERLLDKLKSQNISFRAYGIGNRAMERKGFECLGYAEDLAVVGIQEVLSNFSKIYTVFHSLVKKAKEDPPDLVLLLDYPDFNFRLAKKLKKMGLKIYYYISPQVWAWRQGRVHFIKKYFDKMLVVFPFEIEFYKKFGIEVQFVGHPLLEEVRAELKDPNFRSELRSRHGATGGQFVLGLMPGSRRSELRHHLETQIQTARLLSKQFSQLTVMLFVAPTLDLEFVRSQLPENLDFRMALVKRDPFEMAMMADFILCASGTATLTVGLMGTPMAIMYKMNPWTVRLAGLIMKRPKFFGMSNLILNEPVSKEFFQNEANPENLSVYIGSHIQNPDLLQKQKAKLGGLVPALGEGSASQNVVKAMLEANL